MWELVDANGHYQRLTIGNTPFDPTCVIGQVIPTVIISMA